MFVGVTDDSSGKVLESDNGVDWTEVDAGAAIAYRALSTEDSMMVAVAGSGTNNRVMTYGSH